MKACAVVFTKPNTVEFCPVTCPEPGPRDAVIRATHSWISNGTEGSYLRGERINGDTPYAPGGPWPFPLVPGYQKVGVVEWVGSQIDDLAVGETVFCVVGKVDGMFQPVGGHVSPSVSPRETIWKLPAGTQPLAFSGLVLTQVGYNCGSRAPVTVEQTAVVFGDGPVGQWAGQTLRHRGANVILVGQDDARLGLFERLTGGRGINMKTTEWTAAVRGLAADGVAVAVDAVGTREGTEKVIGLMARGGHIVSAGFCGTDDKISIQALRDLELSLDAVSSLTPARMDATVRLIADGVIQTLPLITHRLPAAKAAEAWQLIADRREHVLGVILDW